MLCGSASRILLGNGAALSLAFLCRGTSHSSRRFLSTNGAKPKLSPASRPAVNRSHELDNDVLAELLLDMEDVRPEGSPHEETVEDAEVSLDHDEEITADSELLDGAATVMFDSFMSVPLASKPREYLYGSLFQAQHPQEVAKQNRGRKKSDDKNQSLVSPTQVRQLVKWCHHILPAVPTDDLRNIQGTSTTASIPLVCNLYVVEDADTLWEAYGKKYKRAQKVRGSSDESDLFHQLSAQYLNPQDIFSNVKRFKDSVSQILKQLSDNIDFFSKKHQGLMRNKKFVNGEYGGYAPSLPLNSYPLTIMLCSSFDHAEACELRDELCAALRKGKILSSHLRQVASDVRVWVLTGDETARWREGLSEGEIGSQWPDFDEMEAAATLREGHATVKRDYVTLKRKPYVPFDPSPSPLFCPDTLTEASEKEVSKALALIRLRKTTVLKEEKRPPPSGLYPLEAKVFTNARTCHLSDRAGIVLPSIANVFVIDATASWSEDGNVDKLITSAINWSTADGSLLIFDESVYRTTCVAPSVRNESGKGFSDADFPQPEEHEADERERVLFSLLSHSSLFAARSTGSEDEKADAGAPEGGTMKGPSSSLPRVFVFQTAFSRSTSWGVQWKLNRAFRKGGKHELDVVCVLSREERGDIFQPVEPGALVLPWAEYKHEHLFPIKALADDCEVALINQSTLVDTNLSRPGAQVQSSSSIASSALSDTTFFLPYVLSLSTCEGRKQARE